MLRITFSLSAQLWAQWLGRWSWSWDQGWLEWLSGGVVARELVRIFGTGRGLLCTFGMGLGYRPESLDTFSLSGGPAIASRLLFWWLEQRKAFLGSNRSQGQGQAEELGSCQDNSGWSGLGAQPGSLWEEGMQRNVTSASQPHPPPPPPLLLLIQLLRRRKETCIFPLLLCTRQVHQSQLSSSSSPLKLVYIPLYRRGRADSRAKGGVEPVLLFSWHRKVLAGPVTKSLAASGLSWTGSGSWARVDRNKPRGLQFLALRIWGKRNLTSDSFLVEVPCTDPVFHLPVPCALQRPLAWRGQPIPVPAQQGWPALQ